jgi:hypothetical protein
MPSLASFTRPARIWTMATKATKATMFLKQGGKCDPLVNFVAVVTIVAIVQMRAKHIKSNTNGDTCSEQGFRKRLREPLV